LVPGALSAALALGWAALGCQSRKPAEVEASTTSVASTPAATPESRPKLVVVVVVDQMRFDYYERFASQWQHGFARLRDEGRLFTDARHQHALTETAPGHATIATGRHPAKHGIVANRWLDRETGERVAAVDDPNATILGRDEPGGVSAANLLREGVGDWMQQADPAAVVISIAIKDRAAILLGGKGPDAALWYDDALGGFTSSSYYADALPEWVVAYNGKDRAAELFGEGWTLSRPEHEYADSRRETTPELVSSFGDYALTKQFPHTIVAPDKHPRNVIRDTPFGDLMALELAREAIAAERMGADAIPDLLLVGLSAGDYAGHRYGPGSVEIHDYYLRLDAALGEFVTELDARVGRDDYVLILTSDHGVAPMVEYSEIPTAGRFIAKHEVPALLARAVELVGFEADEAPELELVHGVELIFADAVAAERRAALRAALAELIREHELIADVWTSDELAGAERRSPYAAAWRMSFHPQRSADLLLQLAPGVATYVDGTGHGTPYDYDQHVPLVIRGPGWEGVHAEPVGMVDLAPTIAALVGVAVGEGVDGRDLRQLLVVR
jgi:predicted AlkP superfamily pyrophosphatase or phosphodiesterase